MWLYIIPFGSFIQLNIVDGLQWGQMTCTRERGYGIQMVVQRGGRQLEGIVKGGWIREGKLSPYHGGNWVKHYIAFRLKINQGL